MRSSTLFLVSAISILIAGATATRAQEAPLDKGFAEALAKFDAAQRDLVNGKADTTKALWSHGDDITLSGGFGGPTEKGWERIGPRLDWVAVTFFRRHEYHRKICGAVVWRPWLRSAD